MCSKLAAIRYSLPVLRSPSPLNGERAGMRGENNHTATIANPQNIFPNHFNPAKLDNILFRKAENNILA